MIPARMDPRPSLQEALAVAAAAAKEAGRRLLAEFHREGGPRGAGDKADIDTEVEEFLRGELLARCPWHWRGEETGFTAAGDPDETRCWVVDPNDGTRPFLEGFRGAAVSIGLLDDGVPVLGVVFAYAYPDGEGDLFAWADGCGPVTRNGAALATDLAAATLDEGAPVFVSQHADRAAEANARCVAPGRYRPLPSIAYRFALVAGGEAVAAVSLATPSAWDLCAGHALLRGVGGEVINQSGEPITYTRLAEMETVIAFGGAPAAVRSLVGRDWHEVYTPGQRGWLPLARLQPAKHVEDAGVLSRAQGCLLGQFVGDALGGQVEFRSSGHIAEEFPGGVRDLSDHGQWRTFAGQATDDSELALMLARTLVQVGRFDPEAVVLAYIHWITSNPFDRGGTITLALSAGVGGEWGASTRLARVLASASRDSQANGSLMRISPLGVFGAADPVRAAEYASEDSALTHPHPLCRDACAAYVRAIAEVIARGGDGEAAWGYAMDEARRPGRDAGVAEMLELARDRRPQEYYAQMGWVRIAFHNAFFQALHAPSLEEGIVDTVGRGGDTDTNAAIAGALLGAIHGREALPLRWRRRVLSCRPLADAGARRPRPMEFWPADAMELAERLLLAGRTALGD